MVQIIQQQAVNVQAAQNPLQGHVFNPNFDPQEYEGFLNQQKDNQTEEQFENFCLANREQLFGMWKRNIYNIVFNQIQISLDDLPDFTYRMSFDESVMPGQMAQHILDNVP